MRSQHLLEHQPTTTNTFSSIIINHLLHVKRATVVFFYCQYKDQPTVKEALSCLLRQLAETSDDAALSIRTTLYASCNQDGTTPSQLELVETLQKTCHKLKPVFLIIDALDELEANVCSELVSKLMSLDVPLLLTSRPLPNLLDLPGQDFEIQAQNNDLCSFISEKLSQANKLRPFLRSPGTRDEIVRKLEIKCKGM